MSDNIELDIENAVDNFLAGKEKEKEGKKQAEKYRTRIFEYMDEETTESDRYHSIFINVDDFPEDSDLHDYLEQQFPSSDVLDVDWNTGLVEMALRPEFVKMTVSTDYGTVERRTSQKSPEIDLDMMADLDPEMYEAVTVKVPTVDYDLLDAWLSEHEGGQEVLQRCLRFQPQTPSIHVVKDK